MGTKYNKTISPLWIFLLLATLNTISRRYVEGLRTLNKSIFGLKPRGTIKTIEALEVGDIIDCVDMYKQLAFDNPLIKDLKVFKMAPSSYPIAFNKTSDSQPKIIQTWNKYGTCPKGTIPIRRTLNINGSVHGKYHNDDRSTREYATVDQHFSQGGHGAMGMFNVWKPLVASAREFSLSQLWVVSGEDEELNSIEAGWIVYPKLFHDARARLFIYWTRDGHTKTGCYNLLCLGFMQTEDKPQIALGAALEPTSVYDGEPISLEIAFSRSREGNWWLQVGDQLLGYYPRQRFTSLGFGADYVAFGGEIVNLQQRQRHTSTAMGSGQFSGEGYKKACFISNTTSVPNYMSSTKLRATLTSEELVPKLPKWKFSKVTHID